ncbi:hypothetical protein LTR56_007742 [Elasticomyces elasticus]|nr:hypothetical protein LTR56_007742 [Elasticomyces elasticus]KAK3661886.1 hypothetical protein LTR22_007260 [Elasticomyces elasticus]KAK4925601.1 hypothetical protein LTR49_007439 [Elasticomyces elasticus]KAK5748568.1 hypothetical protein LTS12_021342 [Elasticomyces elasticus]
MAALPPDLFHLLATELAIRGDYGTLYSCVASSKYLAEAGTVAALYRISLALQSPLKGGENDNLSFAESDLQVMRWSILWRSLILSALDKTLYPYCRHLRELDLRDLSNLLDSLDEPKFRTKVSKQFFAGELSRFHHTIQATGRQRASRLDAKKIIVEIGNLITQHAPMLEVISEPSISDVLSTALPLWVPRLVNLRELELWDGKALEDEEIRNLLHVHCVKLHKLRMHHASGTEPDHYLAGMIGGNLNVLTSFENLNYSSIGPETCLAFNNHGQSLTTLKLALEEDGILALGLLQGCVALQTLHVSALRPSVDLKVTQNDVYLEICAWLKQCGHLTDIVFRDLVSAPDLMLPVLQNEDVKLTSLEINGSEASWYQVKDHHDFHRALSSQSSLQTLSLRGDPDPPSRDDVELLVDVLCHMTALKDLSLYRISDYFTDGYIVLLAHHLPLLESLYVGGYGTTDKALISLNGLTHLRSVTFAGITNFTSDGISTFINRLGEGNTGLVLSVEAADPHTMIQEDAQDALREELLQKANGRFEYQPLRGVSRYPHRGAHPLVPEFDGSDSE